MLEVKLHDIGEGMTEGEVIHYLVKIGDSVKTDQPLVEVQTDKMVAELTSPCTGIVKEICIAVGETIQVGTSLLVIEKMGVANTEQRVKVNTKQTAEQKAVSLIGQEGKLLLNPYKRVLAAPYTRKIARDNNIKIEDVPASDPSGKVTEEDVYSFLNENQQSEKSINEVYLEPSSQKNPDEIPFKGIRKKIAEKMTKSLFTIPHVTHFDEVNMTNLFKMREELKDSSESVSVPAFLIKALVISLKEFPIFNAELDEKNSRILLKKNYHIGIATNTESGLIVPVIHDVDMKSIKQINKDVKELTAKAIAGTLQPFEMKNSTFTVSNVGPLGSTGATPIINYPETALIAFHKTKKQPIINERDEIVIGHIMTLSMAFDHRVADGATAVAFTNRFASLIEQPHKLIMEMI
ncbi:dihydrolipoamide acetyltransferase family protein [Filibacter tadaridae]|uniref:Dihydrolipoamide acetyltransferase component of pyruvate dehydrogenase complex n=1 Tax=Filibacter tadaridae TaxID=2483811 RepID=A0A3P5XE73_9BACL|nr:dihydrolipoamide acetyltransferase family protein [Filibacter tadaridae]VDC29637.1 Dihydrolipoyllysine-residue acetyltransferase component of pyruvate dehydrogenase complex [Filibacter tadaridae]